MSAERHVLGDIEPEECISISPVQKLTALLTRNRDNRPSVVDLAYKCKRRIDRQVPTFADPELQVASEVVCALRALVRGFVAPFSKFAMNVRAEIGRMMNLQRVLLQIADD